MSLPFPEMDPYLERPGLWPDVHHELISDIRAALNQRLSSKYVASVELRVYISDDDDVRRRVKVPDVRVDDASAQGLGASTNEAGSALLIAEPLTITLLTEEIEEAYIEISETETNTLVTIIEILSPTNKVSGSSGRASFLAKRRDVMASDVHWVEIDLLRAGKPTALNKETKNSHYRVVVARCKQAKCRFWPINVRDKLPVVGVPLRGDDPDVPLDLGAVLQSAYDRAAWNRKTNYAAPPEEPLTPADALWADALLREKGLR